MNISDLKQYIPRFLPWIAVAVGLVGSFFLPNATANVMDSRMLNNLIIIEAESISFETELEMSLPDRIALLSSPNSEVLSIASGNVMNMESAKTRTISELAKFFSDNQFEFETDGCTAEDGNTVFVIESNNPAVNLIIWEFRILDRNANEVTVTLDDETGTILKLIYQQRSNAHNQDSNPREENTISARYDMYTAAQQLSDMMTEYYGIPVRLGDYQLGSNIAYYRADMYDRGIVVPMYGVVRASSFTINERL